MIVVLLIAMLITIAVPGFMMARKRSQHKTCLSNLRQMMDAKSIMALDQRLSDGDPVGVADIFPEYIRGTGYPECPSGGTYDLEAVGTPPTCSHTDPDPVYSHVIN